MQIFGFIVISMVIGATGAPTAVTHNADQLGVRQLGPNAYELGYFGAPKVTRRENPVKLFTGRGNGPPLIPGAVRNEDAVHPKCKESCLKGAMNLGCQNCNARFARALASEKPPDERRNAARDELRDDSPSVARIKTEATPAGLLKAKRAEPLALASPTGNIMINGCHAKCVHALDKGGCPDECLRRGVVSGTPRPPWKLGPVFDADAETAAAPPWKIGPVVDGDADAAKDTIVSGFGIPAKVNGPVIETPGTAIANEKRGHNLEIHERQGDLTDANTGIPVVMPDGTVLEMDETRNVAKNAEMDVGDSYTGVPVVMDDGSVMEINVPRGARWY